MTVDVRPEMLATDDEVWFWNPDNVPTFNTGTSTLGALFEFAGIDVETMDPSGFQDAGRVLRGVEDALETAVMNEFMAFRMRELREVAEWSVKHGRRVEWA